MTCFKACHVPPRTLRAVVGATCAAMLLMMIPQFEGVVYRGYLDPVGIPTRCMGDTTHVVIGRRYSEAECRESLQAQLIAHADPVLQCTPVLAGHTYQLAAAVSFAYNIGLHAYCNSTTARRFNTGDWLGACRAMNESDSGKPQWITVRGRVLPGLVKRRAQERALCERGL